MIFNIYTSSRWWVTMKWRLCATWCVMSCDQNIGPIWRGIKLPETSALSPMESSLYSQQFFVFRYAQEEHRHLEKILYVIYDLWVYLQDDQQSFCHKSFRVGALEIILSLPVFLSVFLRELIATRPWNYPTSFRIGTSFLRSTGRAWSVAQSVITSLMLSLK